MRLPGFYVLLVGMIFTLTACPYKEVYKAVSDEEVSLNSITVRPETLFYHSRKDTSTCNVAFAIRNNADSTQQLTFQGSYLVNAVNKLTVEKIYGFGNAFSSDHSFELAPKRDTVLGLTFRDAKSNFGDTLKMVFVITGSKGHTFFYNRTK